MYRKIPAITGDQFIQILGKDGWTAVRKTTHGISLYKDFGETKRLTIIRKGNSPIASGTLAAILGPKQTGIGKKGLLALLNEYGL
jgi:predicted RNA binding protein YcfA (HicA-like mRNA interferase family)